jgi:proteasome regulatory subunit
MRPGRLERHIEVGLPDYEGRLEILKIHTRNMKLENDVDLKDIAKKIDGFSGAEIRALTTEAGYLAIKDGRKKVSHEDMISSIELVKPEEEDYELISHNYN